MFCFGSAEVDSDEEMEALLRERRQALQAHQQEGEAEAQKVAAQQKVEAQRAADMAGSVKKEEGGDGDDGDVEEEEGEDAEMVTVNLTRHWNTGLGLLLDHAITADGVYNSKVADMVPGSPAFECGTIAVGDIVHSINGLRISKTHVTHENTIAQLRQSDVTLVLIRGADEEMEGFEDGVGGEGEVRSGKKAMKAKKKQDKREEKERKKQEKKEKKERRKSGSRDRAESRDRAGSRDRAESRDRAGSRDRAESRDEQAEDGDEDGDNKEKKKNRKFSFEKLRPKRRKSSSRSRAGSDPQAYTTGGLEEGGQEQPREVELEQQGGLEQRAKQQAEQQELQQLEQQLEELELQQEVETQQQQQQQQQPPPPPPLSPPQQQEEKKGGEFIRSPSKTKATTAKLMSISMAGRRKQFPSSGSGEDMGDEDITKTEEGWGTVSRQQQQQPEAQPVVIAEPVQPAPPPTALQVYLIQQQEHQASQNGRAGVGDEDGSSSDADSEQRDSEDVMGEQQQQQHNYAHANGHANGHAPDDIPSEEEEEEMSIADMLQASEDKIRITLLRQLHNFYSKHNPARLADGSLNAIVDYGLKNRRSLDEQLRQQYGEDLASVGGDEEEDEIERTASVRPKLTKLTVGAAVSGVPDPVRVRVRLVRDPDKGLGLQVDHATSSAGVFTIEVTDTVEDTPASKCAKIQAGDTVRICVVYLSSFGTTIASVWGACLGAHYLSWPLFAR
jgi:hypothetical protein